MKTLLPLVVAAVFGFGINGAIAGDQHKDQANAQQQGQSQSDEEKFAQGKPQQNEADEGKSGRSETNEKHFQEGKPKQSEGAQMQNESAGTPKK